MIQRMVAIVFIFGCTAAAWVTLGTTIFQRTRTADVALRGRIESIWGTAQSQTAPSARVTRKETRLIEFEERGRKYSKSEESVITIPLALESSRVRVGLDLEPRRKGLLWYSTYFVTFDATYRFVNRSDRDDVTVAFRFPAERAIYDDFVFTLNGAAATLRHQGAEAMATTNVAPGTPLVVRIAYRSQGLGSWHYRFGADVEGVRDFQLTMKTNFPAVDFPESSLAPGSKRREGKGWLLEWKYRNLVAGSEIAMTMPEKPQPGPLAARISFFAPVSLFFFFFLMFLITTMRGIEVHPMNYFFLAAAFFSFHLLLAYLVDHISVHVAFAICAAVSIGLVVSYLRLVVGVRFALLEAGTAQLVYLVAFSYAFFFEGLTGLAITIGSILTLFLVMQITGRVRWAERFS